MASIQDMGDGKYKLYVELGYRGKRRLRRTKTITAKNITEAKKELVRFEASLLDKKIIDESSLTIEEFYPRWKKLYASDKYSKRQFEEVCRIIDNRFIPEFGTAKLKEITTFDAIMFIKSQKRVDGKKGDLSPSTIHNIYKAVNSLFSVATKWKLIEENPFDEVELPSLTNEKKSDSYTHEEIELIFDRLNNYEWHWQLAVKIAAISGARSGEIMALENKHLDFVKKTILIEQSIADLKNVGATLDKTKSKRSRVVSMPDLLMAEIYEYTMIKRKQLMDMGNLREWTEHTFLFSHETGQPFRSDALSRFWNRFIVENSDIRRLRLHDLRHTSATLLLSKGIHEKVIQKRLGHSRASFTLDTYSHVLEEMDRSASDAFEGLLKAKSHNSKSDAK